MKLTIQVAARIKAASVLAKDAMNPQPLPKLHYLPDSLPVEGAVRLDLEEGIPIFRASSSVQERIEVLLSKQKTTLLNSDEEQELDRYEEMDDYLSFVNRTIRNLSFNQAHPDR